MGIEYFHYDADISGYTCEVKRKADEGLDLKLVGDNGRSSTYQVLCKTDSAGRWASTNIAVIALWQIKGVGLGTYWQSDDAAGETDGSLRCSGMSIKQTRKGEFTITVNYEYLAAGAGSGENGEVTPLDLDPIFAWTSEFEDRPLVKDAVNTAVVNKVGDRFANPVTYPFPYTCLVVTRNEAAYDADYANLWKGKSNNATWNGYPAGYVRLTDVTAVMQKDPASGIYWTVTYIFHFKDKIDEIEVLNAGYRYKKDGTGAPIRALDAKGQPTPGDILLKSNGDKLEDGGTQTYCTFKVAEQVDFTPLNLVIP